MNRTGNAVASGFVAFGVAFLAGSLLRGWRAGVRYGLAAGVVSGAVNYAVLAYVERTGRLDDLTDEVAVETEPRAEP